MLLYSRTTLLVAATTARTVAAAEVGYTKQDYGVDVSFPMHWAVPKGTDGAKSYEHFMTGCGASGQLRLCQSNEAARMSMNRDQPPRQRNYTSLGFAKLRAPVAAYEAVKAYWEQYRHAPTAESWPPGNTYVNAWAAPTKMVSFEDQRFQPAGFQTKDKLWNGVRPILEAWTGMKLKPTSLYGVRVYENNSVLATHVDRLPLVTSAIIQVDQNATVPWPVEVVGHDGVAYEVTLEPGEMALYESHTVLHGRPFPLRGEFFANCFVHFIPVDDKGDNDAGVDFDWQTNARKRKALPSDLPPPRDHVVALRDARAAADRLDELHRKRQQQQREHEQQRAAHASSSNLRKRGPVAPPPPPPPPPPPDEDLEEEGHQDVLGEDFGRDAFATGSVTALHQAAANGDLEGVVRVIEQDPDAVNSKDENAWTPLHESARAGGDITIIEALVNAGADLGARTVSGGSALFLAKKHHNTAVVEYLESIGAPDFADEL